MPHHRHFDIAFLGKVALRPLPQAARAEHVHKGVLPNCKAGFDCQNMKAAGA